MCNEETMRPLFFGTILLLHVTVPLIGLTAGEEPWYRTKVPAITPARWTKTPPPIPEPRRITREDYLKYIKEKWNGVRSAALQKAGQPDVAQQWRSARREAFFYKVTGDEQYARNAMAFIRGDYRYRTEGAGTDFNKAHASCVSIIPSAMAYYWIRSSPSLTKDDHELVRKWLELKVDNYAYYECGAMNRGIGGSGSVMIINYLYPDAAGKPLRSARPLEWHKDKNFTREGYVNYVWPQWWKFRDFYEDSAGYTAHSLEMIMAVLEITDQEHLYQDPGMKKLAERFLAQLSPIGAMPGYGDGGGFNCGPGQWILFMEKWASAYKDGRYKWAAHRLFDFFLQHEQDYYQWGNPIYDTMDKLMEAYLAADDSIQPVEPDIGSVLTFRHSLKWLDPRVTGRWADLVDELIPDKLVLRTGWKPDDAYALLDVAVPMSHGHGNTGSIDSYISEGSVLLSAPSYMVREHIFHNSFAAWPDSRPEGFDWKRDILHGGRCKVRIKDFHKTDRAACAHIHVTDYVNGPTTLDRRIFFLGKAGMWLRDTVTAQSGFTGTIGPAFQFVGVYPKRGENWVNACLTSVLEAFIWEPKYMMQFKNRPLDLLVYFMPKQGAELVADDVKFHRTGLQAGDRVITNNFTDRVWYQKKVNWKGGESGTFDSVLLPHKPVEDGAPLAEGIRRLLDDGPDRAVIGINQAGGRTLYVGINTAGTPLLAAPISTNARWFAVTVGSGGAMSYWVVDATSLKVDGREIFSSPSRRTLYESGSRPSTRS